MEKKVENGVLFVTIEDPITKMKWFMEFPLCLFYYSNLFEFTESTFLQFWVCLQTESLKIRESELSVKESIRRSEDIRDGKIKLNLLPHKMNEWKATW